MSEFYKYDRSDIDFDIDPKRQLIYWDCVGKKYALLEPARPIIDRHMVIGKVGQQNLLPTHFVLKPKDLEATQVSDSHGRPLGSPVPAGISAFIFFGSSHAKQDNLESISISHLGRGSTPKNRLYVAQVGDIEGAGWTPFFAPLIGSINNPLHVILVPNGNPDLNSIVETFVRWEC